MGNLFCRWVIYFIIIEYRTRWLVNYVRPRGLRRGFLGTRGWALPRPLWDQVPCTMFEESYCVCREVLDFRGRRTTRCRRVGIWLESVYTCRDMESKEETFYHYYFECTGNTSSQLNYLNFVNRITDHESFTSRL